VLLSLFELLGFLKDKDRVSFYETLKKELEVKLDHPGTKKFIRDFIEDNPNLYWFSVNWTNPFHS